MRYPVPAAIKADMKILLCVSDMVLVGERSVSNTLKLKLKLHLLPLPYSNSRRYDYANISTFIHIKVHCQWLCPEGLKFNTMEP